MYARARGEETEPYAARPTAPKQSAPGGLLSVQTTSGNLAVNRLLAEQAVQTPVVQRAAWVDQTSAPAGLSAQLSAGLALAQSSPDARPNPLPAWVGARVDEELDVKFQPKRDEAAAKSDSEWDKLPAVAKANLVEATWKLANLAKKIGSINQSRVSAKGEVLANYEAEFKWGDTFNNTDGFLPGVKGLGGYREHYAAPDPADAVGGGFWGQNRVLHATAGTWWVTRDHYANFIKIV